MLRQRMQHMIQEPYPRAHGDLLRRGELRRVRGILGRDDTVLRCFGFFGVCGCWEVGGGFVGEEHAAVEGERDLNFGLVGGAGDGGCPGGEGHVACLPVSGLVLYVTIQVRSSIRFKI